MKICVYAICKNESIHIKRWYDSVKEADGIYVLDTGSTDNSVELLEKLGVHVYQKKYENFRFDEARNDSFKIIDKDYDVYVCLDIDEVISDNFIEEIRKKWKKDTTIGEYTLNSSLDMFNNPLVSFKIKKIHDKNYKWIYPVHEVLMPLKEENIVSLDITVNHYPDNNKSRSIYLPLLEMSLKENPTDRSYFYLAREYMYYKRYNEAIDLFIEYLKLSNWKEERAACKRYIANCYININRYEEAKMWLKSSINEAPDLRDSYVLLSFLYYSLGEYKNALEFVRQALKIKYNNKKYINETYSYNYEIYDLASILEYYYGDKKAAIKYVEEAIKLNPNLDRLKENLLIMKNN